MVKSKFNFVAWIEGAAIFFAVFIVAFVDYKKEV